MGLFTNAAELLMKQTIVNRAFEAGRTGSPPPVWTHAEAQRISDEAYDKGRQSVVNAVVEAVTKTLKGK
jgi:hypothetical protein